MLSLHFQSLLFISNSKELYFLTKLNPVIHPVNNNKMKTHDTAKIIIWLSGLNQTKFENAAKFMIEAVNTRIIPNNIFIIFLLAIII